MRVELDRGVKDYPVKGAHWPVLATLHWGEANKVTEIARLLQLDPTGVTRLIDRLEATGLLCRPRPAILSLPLLFLPFFLFTPDIIAL